MSRLVSVDYKVVFRAKDEEGADLVKVVVARMLRKGYEYGCYERDDVEFQPDAKDPSIWSFEFSADGDSDWEGGYSGFYDQLKLLCPDVKFGIDQVGESWS